MVFDFIGKTAQALVDVTCDTALGVIGESDGPKRKDVAQLLAAGMTVGAIALTLDVTEDVIQGIIDGDAP